MPSNLSESDAIKTLNGLLSEKASTSSAATGACVYTAGSKTYCAQLAKSDCDALGGAWTAGGKCP